ncbi:hypothetical protein SAMN04487948_11855 [Halogranum amylolyticum]|uniref:Uncharacterized protein n=1 Tax=Halogranum amylolyticum TaxID=660520 RepID=A0A1H8VQK6_9EURY|nr:hypothetical protein SAMN04487948_11855 [Halogranum amylolyticum]
MLMQSHEAGIVQPINDKRVRELCIPCTLGIRKRLVGLPELIFDHGVAGVFTIRHRSAPQ